MRSLASVIDVARTGPLEVEIFATTDTTTIAERIASLAAAATGATPAEGLWYRSSVSAVAGVVLDDGREIVVRALRPSVTPRFVEAVTRIQSQLSSAGFPCPSPVGDTVVVEGVIGRAESMLADPGPRLFQPNEMSASARALARLVDLAAGVSPTGLDDHPMVRPAGDLYPEPHSPLFDFASTAEGAGWIDEIASTAQEAMESDDAVISHCDWSARNVRLGSAGLICAYDWESLRHGPESTALGIAAATWRSLGEPPEPLAPAAPEIQRYVELYEDARQLPLTKQQRRSTFAAAIYSLAYTARCEHALKPRTKEGRASGRLAHDRGLLGLIQ